MIHVFRIALVPALACSTAVGCNDENGSASSVTVIGNVEVRDDGDDDGGPARTGGTKPATLPAFQEVGLYSPSSPFNQRVPAAAATDANSDAYIYPNGMSTRGSGLAFLGGLIWPDEQQTTRL